MHLPKLIQLVLDAPDLGAFTTVFRALTNFNPRTGPLDLSDSEGATPRSTWILSPSDYESEAAGGSTVWNHGPIASYLTSSSPETPPDSVSPTDTESAYELPAARVAERGDFDLDTIDDDILEQPSLGLAGALDFLAAERAKFAAQRDAAGMRGNSSATSDGTWRHVIQPRRKRRRKRNRSVQDSSVVRRPLTGEATTVATGDETLEGAAALYDDADDSSSESDEADPPNYYESTPATPPPGVRDKRNLRPLATDGHPKIHHTKSTPSLRLPMTMPIDARVLQLRNLAHKLRMLFPKDAAALSAILSNDQPDASDFVDPRGPVPRMKDTLIHVFIDQSVLPRLLSLNITDPKIVPIFSLGFCHF